MFKWEGQKLFTYWLQKCKSDTIAYKCKGNDNLGIGRALLFDLNGMCLQIVYGFQALKKGLYR